MAKLIYSAIASLDGYIEDEEGKFDWAAPDEEVHASVSSAKTRIERDVDPEALRQLKASAERDLSVGGPELAAHASRAGLVDEVHLFLTPIAVGGGKRCLPADVRLELELLDERRSATASFTSTTVREPQTALVPARRLRHCQAVEQYARVHTSSFVVFYRHRRDGRRTLIGRRGLRHFSPLTR